MQPASDPTRYTAGTSATQYKLAKTKPSAAEALYAADGVSDGKFHGRPIVVCQRVEHRPSSWAVQHVVPTTVAQYAAPTTVDPAAPKAVPLRCL